MPAITVRDVPEETRAELASRAARSGRSLQEYLRLELIKMANQIDTHELIARIRQRKEATGSTMSVDDILAFRDSDRR